MAARVFVSYDYDHDARQKDLLIGQAKNPGAPFSVSDWSIKSASVNWKQEARDRITRVDQVIVLCGKHMAWASGVNEEIGIARSLGKPYFLLRAYNDGVSKPTGALSTDKVYDWTWDNLKALIAGRR